MSGRVDLQRPRFLRWSTVPRTGAILSVGAAGDSALCSHFAAEFHFLFAAARRKCIRGVKLLFCNGSRGINPTVPKPRAQWNLEKLQNDGRGGNKERSAWRPTIGHLYLRDIVHRGEENGAEPAEKSGEKELSKIKLISCITDNVKVAFPYRTFISWPRLSSRRSTMLLSCSPSVRYDKYASEMRFR